MQVIRLLIVNSNKSMLRGLATLFASHNGFAIVGEIEALSDFDYLQRLQPDVVLYGFSCFDEKNIFAISSLKEVCPCTLLIVFSELQESSHIVATFAVGADGYLKTPILPADLVAAVKLTCRAGICFFPRADREMLISLGGFYKKQVGNGESEDVCV